MLKKLYIVTPTRVHVWSVRVVVVSIDDDNDTENGCLNKKLCIHTSLQFRYFLNNFLNYKIYNEFMNAFYAGYVYLFRFLLWVKDVAIATAAWTLTHRSLHATTALALPISC
jgi:hypothetical protein